MELLVSAFAKNTREQVRVALTVFHERQLLDIRVYWTTDGSNWNPSRKGIAIGIEKLPFLLAALHQAADALGQDQPEDSNDENALLTQEEKAVLCEEMNVEMTEVEESLPK